MVHKGDCKPVVAVGFFMQVPSALSLLAASISFSRL